MLLGLLSDTHGHLAKTQAAIALLLAESPAVVLHAGDIGKETILIELAAAFDPINVPVHCVVGNVDVYRTEITGFPDTTCVRVSTTASLELSGKRVGLIHGHDRGLLTEWMHNGDFDLIVTGHTHQRADRAIQHAKGETRVVNPGAVYRASTPGCAVLDLDSGTLRYLDL